MSPGSSGDLTFGVDKSGSLTFEFVKAFQTGTNEPTLWDATAAVLSDFVIPASIDDLKRLNANDVCCVSGVGSLIVPAGPWTLPYPSIRWLR